MSAKKVTVNDLLRADDLREIVGDIDVSKIESAICVYRMENDDVELRRFGSIPEALGLLEIAGNKLIGNINEGGA